MNACANVTPFTCNRCTLIVEDFSRAETLKNAAFLTRYFFATTITRRKMMSSSYIDYV